MLLKELTKEQKYKICRYMMDKYAPIAEDGMRHKSWLACEHCPFVVPSDGGYSGCGDFLFEEELPKELESFIKKGE